MNHTYDVIVVGAGIFGVTAVLELQQRGCHTAILDPGPIPHPLAASTDISKVIRMEYGPDEEYMAIVEQSLDGWHQWNAQWPQPLYHEIGVTMLTKGQMSPGGFEYESYQLLLKRGHHPQRLTGSDIRRRFPAWNANQYTDGFFHAKAGYAESGRVVTTLLQQAAQQGTAVHPNQTVTEIITQNGRVTGLRTQEGETFHASHLLVAAGTWTHLLVPDLAPVMRSVGQPVFHLAIDEKTATLFTPPNFVVYTADINNTGWYGFPLHPRENVLKIANHGPGQRLHPTNDERVVTTADEQHLRAFLRDTFPTIQNAPIIYTRRCLYCDTLDEHLWIDRHPQIKGLTVSSGGSGHGFKFAPLLGRLAADALEAKPNPWLPKFRWRTLTPATTGQEAARHHG